MQVFGEWAQVQVLHIMGPCAESVCIVLPGGWESTTVPKLYDEGSFFLYGVLSTEGTSKMEYDEIPTTYEYVISFTPLVNAFFAVVCLLHSHW